MDGGGESKGSGSGKGCQPSGGKGIRYLQGYFSLTSALLQPYFRLTSAIRTPPLGQPHSCRFRGESKAGRGAKYDGSKVGVRLK